ncbi:MAG: beta-galactosidase [Candidatus Latescibacteria bacterium]|nr:beta-galactosidase [Candidatus Latescibacterota bacterium]
MNDFFVYGAQYYRPPNPARHLHRFHLENIRENLGFNTVKLFVQWNACHLSPKTFDFEELEEIVGICEELGLHVLLQVMLENAPYWMERTFPDARYVNARGQAQELSGNGNTQTGGHPGLCFDHPAVREHGTAFLRACGEFGRLHPCVIGYDCWNEPHIEPVWNDNFWADLGDKLFCYCGSSVERFREWVRAKYQTLEAVNRCWGRYFTEWEDVRPPFRCGTYADWLDWYRFWFDNQKEHLTWRYAALKETDPDRFVMSHAGGVPPFLPRVEAGIDNYSLAEPVDKWGCSFAPRFQNWRISECAGVLDIIRSCAKGKPFWVSEMAGGSGHYSGLSRCPLPRPEDIRTSNWLAAAYGARGILYWCYLSEITTGEAPGFGLVKLDGSLTPRAREAASIGQLFHTYAPIFKDHRPQPEVAILFDPDNSNLVFAQEGKDLFGSEIHIGWYWAVWNADLHARYVRFSDLANVSEKVLIVPACQIVTERVAADLRRYVENGGTLIVENHFGLFSEHGMQQTPVPPFGLAEVCGLAEDESESTFDSEKPFLFNPLDEPYVQEVHRRPTVHMTEPVEASFRARTFVTPLLLTTARPIGECLEHCLAAHHRFGAGEVYYLGTHLGRELFHRSRGALDWVRAVLLSRCRPVVGGKALRPRLIRGKEEALLLLFNDGRDGVVTETVEIPERFGRIRDVYRNVELESTSAEVEVSVPPEDVVVLHLSSDFDKS